MTHHLSPLHHARLAAITVCVAAAAALTPGAAVAGRAQAGSTVGLFSTDDLVRGATTGQGLRDGAVVQTVDVTGDPSSASVQVYDALGAAEVRLDSTGALQAFAGDPTGLAFSGHRAVLADRTAGVLQLGASSSHVSHGVGIARRQAWVTGYSFAELIENFEILYPAGRLEPVTVTLRLGIDGTMTGNGGDNGLVNGLQVYAILGNTDADAGQQPGLSPPVLRTEASVSGQVITISGNVKGTSCPAGKDYCEGFIGLYVALDMRSRAAADQGAIGFGPTGAPFDADYTARLSLDFSPGVTVLQMDNRAEPEALHAWVNRAPVPEPGAAVLMLGGIAGLAGLGRWRAAAGRRRGASTAC